MGAAFPLADPSISGQLPGSRVTGHLKSSSPVTALIRTWQQQVLKDWHCRNRTEVFCSLGNDVILAFNEAALILLRGYVT